MKHLLVLLILLISSSLNIRVFKFKDDGKVHNLSMHTNDIFSIQLEFPAGSDYTWRLEKSSALITLNSYNILNADDDNTNSKDKILYKQFSFKVSPTSGENEAYIKFVLKKPFDSKIKSNVEVLIKIV